MSGSIQVDGWEGGGGDDGAVGGDEIGADVYRADVNVFVRCDGWIEQNLGCED